MSRITKNKKRINPRYFLNENADADKYGIDPYAHKHDGQLGELRWKASVMSGSNTDSELSLNVEVTDPSGKTMVMRWERIWQWQVSVMLGKLNNDPQAAKEILGNILQNGEEKKKPVRGSHERSMYGAKSSPDWDGDAYWMRESKQPTIKTLMEGLKKYNKGEE